MTTAVLRRLLWSAGTRRRSRAVGCDQATPDTVLADVPVPQRQRSASRAYQATSADGGRGGWLVAGVGWLGADREPLAGMKAAASTAGIPGDLRPHGMSGHRVDGKAASHGSCLSGQSGARAAAGSHSAPAWRPGASRHGPQRPGPAPTGSPAGRAGSRATHAPLGHRDRSLRGVVLSYIIGAAEGRGSYQ